MTKTAKTKERPILFSGEMVLAILEGRKTQTRRVSTAQAFESEGLWHIFYPGTGGWVDGHGIHKTKDELLDEAEILPARSRYGPVGSQLWVRETWLSTGDGPGSTHYKASASPSDLEWLKSKGLKWRPSIHMPRRKSRITLERTEARVEFLQDISIRDCKAEGAPEMSGTPAFHEYGPECYRLWFRSLWDAINAKRPGCLWEDNPLIEVVGFEVVER